MPIADTSFTPAQARERLQYLALSNERGDMEFKAQMRAVLKAHDEVEETDPVRMLSMADRLERDAEKYEAEGRTHGAETNRADAARYRRCAARALSANDNVEVGEAA